MNGDPFLQTKPLTDSFIDFQTKFLEIKNQKEPSDNNTDEMNTPRSSIAKLQQNNTITNELNLENSGNNSPHTEKEITESIKKSGKHLTTMNDETSRWRRSTTQHPHNQFLLEEHMKAKNSTVMPFVRKFLFKLRNATPFKNIAILRTQNFDLLNDLSYYNDEVTKASKLEASKGFKKSWLKIYNYCDNKIYTFKKYFSYNSISKCSEKYLKVLHPYQNFKIFWDIIHLIIIAFWIFYIPLIMSFETVHNWEFESTFYTSIFLIIDIFIQCNTAYFHSGLVEKQRKKILEHYFSKYFFSDFMTLMPIIIDYLYSKEIIHFFINYSDHEDARKLHYLKYIFYLKLYTFRDIFNRLLEKFLLKEKLQHIVSLFRIFFISILMAHLFACFFYLIADVQSLQIAETWLRKSDLSNSQWQKQYLYALYWSSITMMTVGYGDIVPKNEYETLMTMITVIIGCGIYAYNINSIGMILQDLNKENQLFTHNVNIINQFMQRKKIKEELQMRIREYLRFIWKEENAQNLEEEHKIINSLSVSLKEELLLEAYGTILKKYPMFYANFSENSLKKVVNIIQDIKLIPDETIFFQKEDYNLNVYFIMKGEVELFINHTNDDDQISIRKLSVGDHFGEVGFFSGCSRLVSARSRDFTTLFSINREEFIKILEKNYEDYEKFRMIQDQILLYDEYLPLKVRCFSCNQLGHLAGNCPMIHFIPDREKVIKKYNFYVDQERKEILRRKKSINPLTNKKSIHVQALKIRKVLESEKKKEKKLKLKNLKSILKNYTGQNLTYDSLDSEDSEERDDELDELDEDESEDEEEEEDEKDEKRELNKYETFDSEQIKEETNEDDSKSASIKDLEKIESIVDKEEEKKSLSNHILQVPLPQAKKRNSASATVQSEIPIGLLKNEFQIGGKQQIRSGSVNVVIKKSPTLEKKSRKKTIESITMSSDRKSSKKVTGEMHKSILKVDKKSEINSPAFKPSTPSLTNLQDIRPSLITSNILHENKKLKEQLQLATSLDPKNSLVHQSLDSHRFLEEMIRNLEGFEKVHNFKNYFPHNNCKIISEKMNGKPQLLRYSKSMRDRKKSVDAKLSKYTFFLEEMKGKMPNAIKKKIKNQLRRKRSGFVGRLPTFAEDKNPNKKFKAKKNWQNKGYFTNVLNLEENKLTFSDVVQLILKNPYLRKQVKKAK